MDPQTRSSKTELDEALRKLKCYHKEHLELVQIMLRADEGSIYPLDLFTLGALHRSINILRGFSDLIESRNFISAAPLLRLQIDNCVRFFAAFIVEKPHDFAMAVMTGKPIREQKDGSGNRMTDSYLVKQLSKKAPWISRVYDRTSGYIHLSETHIFNALRITTEGDPGFTGFIGLNDPLVSDELYLEAIEAFKAATDLFFEYVREWITMKNDSRPV